MNATKEMDDDGTGRGHFDVAFGERPIGSQDAQARARIGLDHEHD